MPSTPSPSEVLKRNRDRGAELARKAGAAPTRALLEKAAADLTRRIKAAKELQGAGPEPFTLAQLRATLRQVEEVLRPLQKGLRGMIASEARVAAEASASGALDYLQSAEKRFRGVNQPLALREAGLLDSAVAGSESSVLRRIASNPDDPRQAGVLQRYSAGVLDDFEETLRLRFVARKPWDEVRDELVEKSPFLQGKPAFWAERIVRTEVMAANNRANFEVLRQAADELGDMVKILSCVMDNRTGADSIAVHGQIRRPEEAFESWFGLFQHPPDRPNDRAIVVPHRLSWPIPAELAPRPDAEVDARWRLEKRKGSPPARPNMSTVDPSAFGKKASAPKAPEPAPEPAA